MSTRRATIARYATAQAHNRGVRLPMPFAVPPPTKGHRIYLNAGTYTEQGPIAVGTSSSSNEIEAVRIESTRGPKNYWFYNNTCFGLARAVFLHTSNDGQSNRGYYDPQQCSPADPPRRGGDPPTGYRSVQRHHHRKRIGRLRHMRERWWPDYIRRSSKPAIMCSEQQTKGEA